MKMQSNLILARLNKEEEKAATIKPLIPQTNIEEEAELVVEVYATAELPTRFGQFRIIAFVNNRDGEEHVAIVQGEPSERSGVVTRIHSECLTGDVFGSLKCDCGSQLDLALQEIAQNDVGIILYMRQEGRGIGLANKVKAYSLQDGGMDTVEANLHLGFDDDLRDYDVSAEMLKLLGVKSIELLTNNPSKVDGLCKAGIDVVQRRPIKTTPNPHNYAYLETKRTKSGHLL
ncbi:MAG: GTP cyclohydrolase II [Bradymonadaceae bacterium]